MRLVLTLSAVALALSAFGQADTSATDQPDSVTIYQHRFTGFYAAYTNPFEHKGWMTSSIGATVDVDQVSASQLEQMGRFGFTHSFVMSGRLNMRFDAALAFVYYHHEFTRILAIDPQSNQVSASQVWKAHQWHKSLGLGWSMEYAALRRPGFELTPVLGVGLFMDSQSWFPLIETKGGLEARVKVAGKLWLQAEADYTKPFLIRYYKNSALFSVGIVRGIDRTVRRPVHHRVKRDRGEEEEK